VRKGGGKSAVGHMENQKTAGVSPERRGGEQMPDVGANRTPVQFAEGKREKKNAANNSCASIWEGGENRFYSKKEREACFGYPPKRKTPRERPIANLKERGDEGNLYPKSNCHREKGGGFFAEREKEGKHRSKGKEGASFVGQSIRKGRSHKGKKKNLVAAVRGKRQSDEVIEEEKGKKN